MKDEGVGRDGDEERSTHSLGPTFIIITTPQWRAILKHSQSEAPEQAETSVLRTEQRSCLVTVFS